MRILMLVLLGIMNITFCFGQTDKLTVDFLKVMLPKGKVIYTDKVDNFNIDNMVKAFTPDSVYNKELAYTNAIKFTGEEKKHIIAELNKMRLFKWEDHVVENSSVFSTDSVRKVFSNGNGWTYFNQKYGTKLFGFSKPIFLRNNTICLFSIGYGCGFTCGSGGFYIYQKKNGIWEQIATISSWIS